MSSQQPEDMSREQLMTQLRESRDEVARLRQLVSSGMGGDDMPSPNEVGRGSNANGNRYDISMNVLLIGGTEGSHNVRSVQLQDVLNKSVGRSDNREADTPVYFTGQHHVEQFEGRLSCDNFGDGRSSTFSVGDGMSPGRVSATNESDWGRTSSEVHQTLGGGDSPGTAGGGPGIQRGGRPAPLNPTLNMPKGKLRLDADAIVSHQTLHAFHRNYANRPLSPQSNSASSLLKYLTDFFAKKNDFNHMDGDKESFARVFLSLCNEVEAVLKDEPAHPSIPAPAYVFGDIHGNMRDLLYFGNSLVNFQDFRFTPYNLVFLGDYVDRGEFSIEVVAYLFALKVLAPHRVTLLRGNHEDTLVNGDVRTYGDTSLKGQCITLFSNILGEQVWKRANQVFTYLPLTGNIDKKIFCTHGGLPRWSGGEENRMELLQHKEFPRMESFFQVPEDEDATHALFRQVASDVCWSDPADDDRATNEFGFGNNPRGQGVILFGNKAVDDFLEHYGFEYIFRAHQEKSDGLKLSKNARVMTIFSTSAYVGHSNGAGVVFVGTDHKIRFIIKQADLEETM